jgi:molecular chaperone HtpG
LHHGYIGAISEQREVRGLRARIGDIQVGGDDIFASVFPEARFNSWVVGELHVIDPRIIPNGRRDDFEANAASQSLTNQLTPWVRRLTQHTRESSMRRARAKKFTGLEAQVSEWLATVEQGLLGSAGAAALGSRIESSLSEMEKVAKNDLFVDVERQSMVEKVAALRERTRAVHQTARPRLVSVPTEQRLAYERVLELVYETVESPAAARALVEQVVNKLEGLHEAPTLGG